MAIQVTYRRTSRLSMRIAGSISSSFGCIWRISINDFSPVSSIQAMLVLQIYEDYLGS